MLLANYAQVNRNTGSDLGIAFNNPHAVFKATCFHRFYINDANVANQTAKSAWNNGYSGSFAWFPAPKAGGLGANRTADFSVVGTASGAMGVNGAGDAILTWDVPNAQLQLVVSASGSATIVVICSASVAGALAASGSTNITINTNNPTLGAIINAVASAIANTSLDGTITATGDLSGDITPFTELSPENLAAAVWGTPLDGDYTAADVSKLVAAILAGKTSVVNNGDGTATITFRDLSDTTNRAVFYMDGSSRMSRTDDV